jgi:hypothetical protein
MTAPDWPRGVTDPLCPDEHVITTSTDRRLLWHLEMVLSGLAGDRARETGHTLRRYLYDTCDHHWHDYVTCCEPRNEGCIPPHRQCLWCNDVEWQDQP